MRLLAALSTISLVASVAAPVASAKIFPYDFGNAMDVYMNLQQGSFTDIVVPMSTEPSSEPTEPMLAPLAEPDEMPVPMDDEMSGADMMVSDMPGEGTLTRAQFAEAIATRLYTVDAHMTCFGELAGTMNFELLFKDVPVDSSYASSVCLMMLNGLMKGSTDMLFHPSSRVTAAEAAAVFSRLALMPRSQRVGEAWYERYMEAMRSVDAEFTLRAWETFEAKHLRHTMCIYGEFLPQIDPMGEFVGEC